MAVRESCGTFQAVEGEIMNWDQIEGKWKQLKGSAKQHFGKLTDDDLEQIRGNRDMMIGKLQERYGIAKDQAQKQADQWMAEASRMGQAGQAGFPKPPAEPKTGHRSA
jgi:uncharacterized protein YjbJ (UPF0337 family)